MDSVQASQKLNILVLEDDDNLRESILDALEIRGHDVHAISCAEELPEQPGLLHLDCVVLDLNLPGEDGLSVARRLRECQPALGIIMLSARASSPDKSTGYASGADIYLTKPASLDELNQAILALARRLHGQTPDVSGAPRLNVSGLVIPYRQQNIALTQSETALIVAFSRASQNTLESWQIAEALDLDITQVRKSVIEGHVSRLRKKLPQVGNTSNPIKSIRGVGYKLCIPIQATS